MTPQNDTLQTPDFSATGKVALITGSGRGIGLSIARALAAAGAAVAIQDIDVSVAQAEVESINRAGGKAIALAGDITDLSLPARAVQETITQLGGLHILVNNAAIQSRKPWLELTVEEMQLQLSSNLISPILFCQQAVPIFQKQKWGRIINISSIQGRGGNTHMLAYSLGKAAMDKLTMSLARTLGKENITVNGIAPGWINTYRNRDDFPTDDELKRKGNFLPLGRIGNPEDFGGMALLLCSAAGAYITGQTLYVDGGMSA